MSSLIHTLNFLFNVLKAFWLFYASSDVFSDLVSINL